MAVERRRGCGYRVVGGLYLVGGGLSVACDRLPYPIGSCPVCGQGIHFARAFTEINPARLFNQHHGCRDDSVPCKMCQPSDDLAYIMMVGSRYYTPESFIEEALIQGVSKRIPFIPKKLELGRTVIYIAHPKVEKRLAIIAAFTPQRVEKLIWESEATPRALRDLEKRDIMTVIIPDGDPDHAPKNRNEA